MPTYTVIALFNPDDPDTFLVAGVLAGRHHTVDSKPCQGAWERYVTIVSAACPDAAEERAWLEFPYGQAATEHDPEENR